MSISLLLDGTEQYHELGGIPVYKPIELSHLELQKDAVMVWLQDNTLLDHDVEIRCKWSNLNSTPSSTAPAYRAERTVFGTGQDVIRCESQRETYFMHEVLSLQYTHPDLASTFETEAVSVEDFREIEHFEMSQALVVNGEPLVLFSKQTESASVIRDTFCKFGERYSLLEKPSLAMHDVLVVTGNYYICRAPSNVLDGSLLDGWTGLTTLNFVIDFPEPLV